MSKRRNLINVLVGCFTCLLVVVFSAPAVQPTSALTTVEQYAQADLRQAKSVLMAQGAIESGMMRYIAILSKDNVVPTEPSTDAFGTAGAVLAGDMLVVRGDFRNLSSALRDYTVDPVDPPNPNITSGVHIHRGEPSANGPFQYALTVNLDDSGNKGRFSGEYRLTDEQVQALNNGMLYLDIHTTRNRAGELRGVLAPY
ncbi:CHRD domain-containing protein [Leptolyngbya sp. AN02str]|uniref:CHRD domain-containing protein n=1 Tax=Leptolyngbya sp. AN02str TaxID=3423363 RepID=UPI003D31CFD0